MRSKILISIVILLVISLTWIILADSLLVKRITCKLFDKHIVDVQTDHHLDVKKVSIKWISSKGERFIYQNGQKVNRIDYVDGDYAFKIYYKDSLVKEVGHYITQWDNNNNYSFYVYNMNGIVSASFKVIGPDTIPPLYWNEVLHTSTLDPSLINESKIFNQNEKDTFSRNTIELTLDSADFDKIEENITSKFSFKKARISINNIPIELKKIKIAGASTLKYRRKNYKISLEKPCPFNSNGTTLQLENFRLLSLSMDPCYFHMFISYNLMKEVGLFDLYFSYVELKINNETQGIYLLIEDPEHYALNRKESSFILRRDYRHSNFQQPDSIKKFDFKSKAKNSTVTDDKHIQAFKSIYASLYSYDNEDLFESLNKYLDVNKYMKWMAINYFLCNGDYTDELFFFTQTTNDNNRFDIIPWDYDDILRTYPHEGWEYRHAKIGNKLIYSIEDSLDLKIANDKYLYCQYLNNLRSMLETIDDEVIKRVFDEAFNELTPLLKTGEIISMSQYDKTRVKSLEEFIFNLKASYLFLIERRKIINNRLLQYAQLKD